MKGILEKHSLQSKNLEKLEQPSLELQVSFSVVYLSTMRLLDTTPFFSFVCLITEPLEVLNVASGEQQSVPVEQGSCR